MTAPDPAVLRRAAEQHVTSQGMRVMDRGWSLNGTVIDLLAADGLVLVAVRVLSGTARLERKRAMRLAALSWAAERSLLFSSVRVDVLKVCEGPEGLVVTHEEGRG